MVAIIAAYDKKRAIGKNGRIPWNIPGEKSRFRELTMGNTVIMGRRTYEEIGKPLPGRSIIVLSSHKSFSSENLKSAKSLSEAMEMADGTDIFISGGAEVYKEALSLADTLFITEIDGDFDGDRFFPQFDKDLYEKTEEKHVYGSIPYTYYTFKKKEFRF